jgi:two-component system sensor histidine kinase RpfC
MKEKIRYFIQKVREREGEYEQVTLRVIYSLAAFLYLSFEYILNRSNEITLNIYIFSLCSFLVSVGLLIVLFYKQKSSRKRQWISMVGDIFAISYGMFYLREMGFLLFGVFLWLIVGNGIRYGLASLFASYIFSLIGFSVVITFNPFWHSQPFLSVGLLLTLTLIPLYLSKLLKRLNLAIHTAREANKAKSNFLAHMSHEMRTPLNGVIGTCDLLTTTPLNGEQFELVNTLKISSQTLLQLIENVLDFSKIESGKLASEKQDFDLHQLIRGTLDMFRPQARFRGLRLDIRFSPDTCYLLYGDTLHLRQIIINLVGNAIKFTDKGSVELRVSTIRQDEFSARIRFEVIDTGIGIPSEAQKTIFDSFTQASTDISRQYGGSGLGTTISKQLVLLMGGTMGLQSELGVGSVFWFEIPFDKQPEAITTTNSVALRQNNVITFGMKSRDRDSIGSFLESWGIQFSHEVTIVSFFARLQQLPSHHHRTTIILCSPQNLGMDAREFVNKVQIACPSHELPLILVTHGMQQYQEEEQLEMGYSCLLRTPIDKTLLFNALHGIMAPQPQQGVISFKEYYQRSSLEKAGVSILLAEDNGTSRKIISKILEYGGHKVDTAENGEEALDKLEVKRYDLIILDMNMPLMGGLDVLKLHRATSYKMPQTPVIILTANATSEAMLECQNAGADTYLSKPVDAATLLKEVGQLTASRNENSTTQFEDSQQSDQFNQKTYQQHVKLTTLRNLELLGEGQEDFMSVVIHGFINETEKMLESMRTALSGRNFQLFKEITHTLKGSAGNIGAETLYLICSEIMQTEESVLPDRAEALFQETQQCFKATQAALTLYLSNPDCNSILPSSMQ